MSLDFNVIVTKLALINVYRIMFSRQESSSNYKYRFPFNEFFSK